MSAIFDNLINGNLSDAKRGAKRKSLSALRAHALEFFGWSEAKSFAVAAYLKGEGTFQAYCDAE